MTRAYVRSECAHWAGRGRGAVPSRAGPSPQTGPRTRTGSVAAELSAILLDAVTDKDPVVQEQVCSALCALGQSQPEEALRACEEHLRHNDKVGGWALRPCQGTGGGFV